MDTDKKNKESKKDMAVWAITPGGAKTGLGLCSRTGNARLYLPEKKREVSQKDSRVCFYKSLTEEIQKQFHRYACHVFIFATGIAVRIIGPLLDSKVKDPAVVVMDEKGYFAISLVSGHIGGANAFARKIADIMGATPVITTATDLNHLPSIDMLAVQNKLIIETPENIKHVNMKFLEGEAVSILDPLNIISPEIPEDMIKDVTEPAYPDIVCTHERHEVSRETLVLRPKNLSLGIGCNRNTPAEEIINLIKTVFEKYNFCLLSAKVIGSTEVKKDEAGLIKAAEELKLPLHFYTRDQLNAIDTIENPSAMAEKHLGVKSVCEAAAIHGAGMGPLLIPKQKTRNVTLAVALKE